MSGFRPRRVVQLQADPGDAVVRALLGRRQGLGIEPLPVPLPTLLADLEFDSAGWTPGGRRIDPATIAVVNRLPRADRLEPSASAAEVRQRRSWARLRHELERFGYASSLPTAPSILGCRGSLVDQWTDLPGLLPGLCKPAHSTPSDPRELESDIYSVDRWALCSLGRARAEASNAGLAPGARLDHVRPPGRW